MGKVTPLCMIAFLLLSSLTYASATRPGPFHDITPVKIQHMVDKVPKVDVEENCTGIEEQDCLMRRTLQAHIDYIYTQKQQP
ncbi:hypothetical protein LguiB_022014 [Lonicera macranthoides]